MKLYRSILAAVIAALVCALLASCASKEAKNAGPSTGGGKTFTVGVSLLTEEHAFYRELKAAFETECKARNLNPTILSCNMDLAKQTDQVENFINRGVNAIVVCPADSAGIAGAVQAANKAGIPVFTADIAAQGNGKVVSHIASDNIAGGQLAGEYMAKLLKGNGTVAIVNDPVVQSVQDRVKGFKLAVGKYPGIKIVDDLSGDGQRDKSLSVTENLLQKHAKLDGIFAINDNTALGALAAVEHAGRKDLVIVGYDGDPEARKKIADGTALKADAVQYPAQIGKITADTVADKLAGKSVHALVPINVGIIDQESLKKEKE